MAGSLILGESLAHALDRACRNDDILSKVREKVESLLEEFASTRQVRYKKLRVIDVATDQGDIQPPLLRMIRSTPRPSGRTEKRHRRYMTEIASCVRRLIRAILDLRPERGKKVKSSPESILLKQVPDYLKAVLDKFPKLRAGATRGIAKDGNPIGSLTPNGQTLLLALCNVDRMIDISQEVSPLNCLLLDHGDLIRGQLHAVTSSAGEFENCYNSLTLLLKKLKLKRKPRVPLRVKVEDWPQPLRDEYHEFLLLARGKTAPSDALLESAVKYEFSIRLEEGTIRTVTVALCQLLGLIPHNGRLGIGDLIRLQPTGETAQEGSKAKCKNSHIELVREVERAKQTPRKRAGYDSVHFRACLYAIRSMAARLGYSHLIEAFNEAYSVRLDKETPQEHKNEKKRGITRGWIDKELEATGVEFDRIVNKGLFKRGPGRSHNAADKAMRLCLFYPQVLTKRLLGYRQQGIRGCTSGRNITFMPDGTVIIHFDKREVKNRRELRMEMRPTEDGTHEHLRKVLIKYNKKVIPYIQKHGGKKLGKRFFATFDGHTGGFRAYTTANDYEKIFKGRVEEFFNTQELPPELQDAIHSHFMRGVCTDWMILDLHMSIREASEVLGDTEKVVEKDYLDRNRVYDATKPFDRVNAERLRAKKELDGEIRKKDRQIETLMRSLSAATRQINDLTAQLAALQGAGGRIGATA